MLSIRRTGVGDRLASLNAAWRFAKATGRTLVVDWRFGGISPDLGNAFGLFFEPTRELAGVRFIADRHIAAADLPQPRYPKIWNTDALIELPILRSKGFTRDQSRAVKLIRSQRDIGAETVVFDGCINDGIADLSEVREFYSALRPVSAIASEVARFRREKLADIAIGVHIRNGNGGDIMGHRRFWDSEKSAFLRCAAAVNHARKSMGDATPVFLVTDSRKIEVEFQAIVRNVIVRPKPFRADGAGELHLDNQAWRHQADAVIEMLLLAECKTLIRYPPGSFFSLYAAALKSEGSRELKTTYDLLRPWDGNPLSPSIVSANRTPATADTR